MITPELITGVKKLLTDGKNPDEVRGELLRKGWSSQEADEVFRRVGPVVAPPAGPTAPAAPPKKHSVFWPVFASLVVILVAAGAVWGYPDYWGVTERLGIKSRPNPNEVFLEALTNTQNLTSASYAGEVNLAVSSPEFTAPARLSVTYRGAGETGNWLETSSTFDLMLRFDSLPEEVAGFLGDSQQLNLSVRKIGSNIYFLLSGLPQSLQLFLPQLGDLRSQWVSVDLQQYKNKFSASSPLFADLEDPAASPEVQEFMQILRSKHPFNVIPMEGNEEVARDASSYQYELVIDKTKLRELLIALSESAWVRTQAGDEMEFYLPTDEDWQDFMTEFDQITLPRMYISIDKEAKLFKRFDIIGNFSELADYPMAPTAQFSFNHRWLNYNQPVEVTAPVESTPLEEVLGGLFGGLFASSTPPVPITPIIPIPDNSPDDL